MNPRAIAASSHVPPHALLRVVACVAGGLAVGAIISLSAWYILTRADADEPASRTIVIPPGTAARIAQGESPPAVPRNLTLRTGSRLTFRNDDSATHRIDDVVLEPGDEQSLPPTAFGAGRNQFVCSFHVAGSIQASLVGGARSPRSAVLPALLIGLPLAAAMLIATTVSSRLQT